MSVTESENTVNTVNVVNEAEDGLGALQRTESLTLREELAGLVFSPGTGLEEILKKS